MRIFTLMTLVLCAAMSCQCVWADGEADEKEKTKAQERREAKQAEREAKKQAKQAKAQEDAIKKEGKYVKVGTGFDFTKEFETLNEGATLLADVKDATQAAKVAKKLCVMFNSLPIPMQGTESELELWATEANKLNRQMERLKKQPWFVTSGLQEAWTLATDPFSRRKAQR